MSHGPASPGRLSQGERRALASFLAGRLPAGQLHAELCRARQAVLAPPEASGDPPAVPDGADAVPAAALRAA
jgi:hypothetical protein